MNCLRSTAIGACLSLALCLSWAAAQDKGRTVSFQGLRLFTESKARALIGPQLELIDEQGPSTARADDAAFFLEREMRDCGFEDARVIWEMPSTQQVILKVREGQRLILTGVRFQGHKALPDEALFELMTADTRERLNLKLSDEIPYVVKDVAAGRRHVKDFYELLGYISADVTLLKPEVDPNPPGNRAWVRLLIDEGSLYKVGEILLGAPPHPSLAEKFQAVQRDYLDQSFSPSLAAQVEARLRQIAREAGYFEAEISVTAQDPVDRGEVKTVDLVTEADYGRRFSVREIDLEGNESAADLYFERSFSRLIDAPYDPSATNALVGKMLESGNFTRVTAEPQIMDAEAGALRLQVEVEEAKSRSVGIFGGYGSWEGAIIGFDYVERNLFGMVKRFDARVEFSQRGIEGELTYADPRFLWSEWEASAGIYSRTRFNEGYSKFETGLLAEVGREFFDLNSVRFFAQSSFTEVFEADIERRFLGETSYFDSFAGVAYELDWRDDPAGPRRGGFLHASSSFGSALFRGRFHYLRSDFEFSYHLPIGPTTLHLGAEVRGILPLGDDRDFPIDLRLFSGGPRNVRSFPEREMHPLDSGGYPVGGQFSSTFKVEYEIPVSGPLSVAIFGDAGNLLTDFSDAGLDDLHYATGAGLRVRSPLGPLRLDYGHNLNRGEREPSGTFHVGFGSAF